MKLLLAVVFCSLAVGVVACSKCKRPQFKPTTDDDKVFYTMGAQTGLRYQPLSIDDRDITAFCQGLSDGSRPGQKLAVEATEVRSLYSKVLNDRLHKTSAAQKELGKKFVEKFLQEPGAAKTNSGLAYKILKDGTGKKPTAEDRVEVHYHGTLVDGTVFDSSVERGQPVPFFLSQVIKGWTEGIQLVGEGGKIRLVIPSELAYGEEGAPGKIPGGATLVFDVELLKVFSPEELKKEAAKKAPKGKAKPAKVNVKKK